MCVRRLTGGGRGWGVGWRGLVGEREVRGSGEEWAFGVGVVMMGFADMSRPLMDGREGEDSISVRGELLSLNG